MLISYPFLPSGLSDNEDAQLGKILSMYTRKEHGFYPVSHDNRWHGGIHLCPCDQTLMDEPVRAIADGEVVAYRIADKTETYPSDQESFDNSFILIRHSTESGENTKVVFYSLYMHLRARSALKAAHTDQMPTWLQSVSPSTDVVIAPPKTRVWRKEVLGFVGKSHLGQSALHFEIFALDADFKHFWRDRKAIPQGQHGSEDVFGDIHYIIPAECDFTATHPHAEKLTGRLSAHAPQGIAGKSEDALHVVVRLEKGKRIATTYRIKDGKRTQIGQLVVQDSYEYDLFFLAKALYPDRPSAGFEYLRFGRILNGESTQTHQNWQWVQYGDGPTRKGYIDLAANNVSVLSDADFPLDWECVDEGDITTPIEGLCQVPKLYGLIGEPTDENNDRAIDAREFQRHIASKPGLAEKLRYLICKSPTEWDERTLEARYQALTQPGQPLANPDDWQAFLQHAKKLTFWSAAGMTETSVWHFHPLQFIRHYQNCGWLSLEELAMTLPRHQFYFKNNSIFVIQGQDKAGKDWRVDVKETIKRLSRHSVSLNNTMRKYGITSKQRQAIFLSQIILEAAQWRYISSSKQLLQEWGFGEFSKINPATQFYGPFYGRGIMQLTWAGNYKSYGEYRAIPNHKGPYKDLLTPTSPRITKTSKHYTFNPKDKGEKITWYPRYDPDIVATNPDYACDSGAFFWGTRISKGINSVCDAPFSTENVGRVSKLVNGGGNGYHERQAYTAYLMRLLTNDTATSDEANISTPRGTVKVNFLRPKL